MYHDQDLRKFKVFVVQSLSHLELFETPLTAAHQGLLFFTISWSYSNSCPLSWWYHLTISSSATLFSFCLQSCPASGSFPVSQLFASGGQSIHYILLNQFIYLKIETHNLIRIWGLPICLGFQLVDYGAWICCPCRVWVRSTVFKHF